MDFFEAQAHAKKRTSRLVWLFALAVLGTVIASYFATVLAINAVQNSPSDTSRHRGRGTLGPATDRITSAGRNPSAPE